MAEGYAVILDDLRTLSDAFDRESKSLETLKPKTRQHAPDTGDADLDGTLGDVLDNLSTLYQILVDTIHTHCDDLHRVHQTYQDAEEDTRALYDQMKDAWEGG